MGLFSWIIAAVFGAGIMYLLDPQQGKERREVLRRQINSGSKKLGQMAEASQHHNLEQKQDNAEVVPNNRTPS